ncbi:unnamed protein product [Cladocopium goreaui]|uniref:Pleckstrin-likey domain-containing protein 1 n=1 Tax=Cladocopium goreaui TaxID=2562237 RepID=A0A9P1FL82_9DINO|nr:unnamed protein product [Cladocopium goreaui]CAI3999868.1 unnamed protein product [Cladocopium goreaui]
MPGRGCQMESMFAESLKLGCCEVDLAFLKKKSRKLCGSSEVPVDPEITVKVVKGEVDGLVYEWDLQDSWPIHFSKARLQILSFADLEVTEVSRNRTLVRMRPEVLQVQTGSQIWDHKASRRGLSEWHSGAMAQTVLPPGFQVEELLVVHELLLKHSLHKAWSTEEHRCHQRPGGPVRAVRGLRRPC